MTLLDFGELCRYWQKSPPTHIMVAAYLGIGKEKTTSRPLAGQMPIASSPPQRRDDPPAVAPETALIALAGAGMLQMDVHNGFAVQEAPFTFDDLKRLNGL